MSALGLAALVAGGILLRAALLGVSPLTVFNDLLFKAGVESFAGFGGGSFGQGTGGGSDWDNTNGGTPGKAGGGSQTI